MRPNALIVLARVPKPGRVKSRLAASIGNEAAAALYEAFLADAMGQYERLDVDVRLYLAPTESEDVSLASSFEVPVFWQSAGDFGTRMLISLAETFAAGYERAAVIGSDHPTLPSEFIQMAFDVLDQPLSASIGPTSDGGYYLLAMNDLFPTLFSGIKYGRSDVLEKTLERAATAVTHLTVLPEWYDVDDASDLPRLAADLAGRESAPR
ncbi:MAG: TIGR04282 family arsenosugar biosynthesis glycosyltransferase, partial [Bacteroidota bacterium]